MNRTDPLVGHKMSTTAEPLQIADNPRNWLAGCAIIAGLLFFLYAPVLKALASQWWTDPDYGHGFFVPLFSGYILWRERGRLRTAEIWPDNSGLLVMVGGICLLLLGSLAAELFTSRFSLLVLLSGVILFLAGWEVLRAVSFPLGFLIFMIPLPAVLFNQITFPLQLLASRLAAYWLGFVRVPVLRDGNILVMSNYSLEVVEACSGIRSLITLVSLAVAYGYLAENRNWVRCSLAILMVPIAIATNAIRIMVAGVLAHRFGSAIAESFLHEFSGWLIFLAALILLLTAHRILQQFGKGRAEVLHHV